MRIGAHLSLWQRAWEEDVTPYIERAAALGFDGVEISLFTLRALDVGAVRRRIEAAGLGITCSTGLGPETDITSEDPAVRRAGMECLQHDISLAADAGSSILCGVLYAAWGKVAFAGGKEAALARSIDGLRQASERAERAGVRLGLEALNRYETSLLNTAAQARALADAVALPSVGVHLDTYHMNIEEHDMAEAIVAARPRLIHVHCANGDRSAPGHGPIPWDRVVAALRAVGYDGWLVLECGTLAGTEVAASFSIWRDLGAPDAVAAEGLAFLRSLLPRP